MNFNRANPIFSRRSDPDEPQSDPQPRVHITDFYLPLNHMNDKLDFIVRIQKGFIFHCVVQIVLHTYM